MIKQGSTHKAAYTAQVTVKGVRYCGFGEHCYVVVLLWCFAGLWNPGKLLAGSRLSLRHLKTSKSIRFSQRVKFLQYVSTVISYPLMTITLSVRLVFQCYFMLSGGTKKEARYQCAQSAVEGLGLDQLQPVKTPGQGPESVHAPTHVNQVPQPWWPGNAKGSNPTVANPIVRCYFIHTTL